VNREEIIEFLKGKVKELEREKESKKLELKQICDNGITHRNINEIERLYDELQILDEIKRTIENLTTNERLKNEVADKERLIHHLGSMIDTYMLVEEVHVGKVERLIGNENKYNPEYLKEITLHLNFINEFNKYALKLMDEI
jgi:hypothetical protein